MKFFVVGMNHKTAPVELRERLAVNLADLAGRARQVKQVEGLDEIVLLTTCNRVEIYAVANGSTTPTSSLFRSLGGELQDLSPNTYFFEDLQATQHLFRVAAGLDSMVVGETEITGQVKTAYDIARKAQLTGGTLNRVFQKAFQVVKEIRTRTGIGRGATSVGGAAVELAGKIFPHDLASQSVMIVGAGQMGAACLRHLVKQGARSILVCNRSFDRAIALANEFDGRAVRFEDSFAAMVEADIVVVSTALPKVLLQRADIERVMVVRRNRPLILIDISVPRNIDPLVNQIDNAFLYNIDDLSAIVSENVRHRERDLALCNQIIGIHALALMEKLNSGKEGRHEWEGPFQAGWAAHGAAVGAS